jgi:hypothetical protein
MVLRDPALSASGHAMTAAEKIFTLKGQESDE